MQSFIILFAVFLATTVVNAEVCPDPDAINHYVVTKLRSEETGDYAKIKVYYKLLNPFDPAKSTLLVLNGGPGEDHSLIEKFRSTVLDSRMNIVGFDHRGIGCTKILSPETSGYEPYLYSTWRTSDDLEAIRKDLLGNTGKWFVYGVSYGTILGQRYVTTYQNRVLGAILDSALHDSREINVGREQYIKLFVRDDQQVSDAFDRLVKKYPNLKNAALRNIWKNTYSFFTRHDQSLQLFNSVAAAPSEEEAAKILEQMPATIPLQGMSRQILCEEIWDYPEPREENDYYWWMLNQECADIKPLRRSIAFADALQKLSIPVFIWGGEYDPVTPIQGMREMAALVPQAIFWENRFAGHSLLREKKDCALKLADLFYGGAEKTEIDKLAQSPDCQSAPHLPADQNEIRLLFDELRRAPLF